MIQDIYPHVFHNEFDHPKMKDDDIILDFKDNQVIMKSEDSFFTAADIHCDDPVFLFRIDERNFYFSPLDSYDHVSFTMQKVRSFKQQDMAFAVLTARQLVSWMSSNTFCGKCGNRMIRGIKERSMCCPQCGNIVYPRIDPAVIIGVISSEGKLLVTHYNGPRSNLFWALVAGYTEIGETVEQTVIREVKEETGIDVCNPVYYKSQPWGMSSSILLGFWCRTCGDETLHVDQNELSTARWADRSETDIAGGNASLTAEMIREFQKGNIPYEF